MNIYVVVEGEKATKKIYKTWIPLVNPELQHIDYLKDLEQNNFFILAGFGQPQFLNNRVVRWTPLSRPRIGNYKVDI